MFWRRKWLISLLLFLTYQNHIRQNSNSNSNDAQADGDTELACNKSVLELFLLLFIAFLKLLMSLLIPSLVLSFYFPFNLCFYNSMFTTHSHKCTFTSSALNSTDVVAHPHTARVGTHTHISTCLSVLWEFSFTWCIQ